MKEKKRRRNEETKREERERREKQNTEPLPEEQNLLIAVIQVIAPDSADAGD
jgi:hypothetical protein